MIKERILFEGTTGDNINEAILIAINKTKELDEDVFIRWNGATVRVNSKDTLASAYAKYERELSKIDLVTLNDNGELISKRELAKKIANLMINYLDCF